MLIYLIFVVISIFKGGVDGQTAISRMEQINKFQSRSVQFAFILN